MSPLATLSPEQLALRKQGVGASEVAAILGLDPYRTALDVYLDKRGLLEPFPENRFTHWGKRLEAVLVEEYRDRHPDLLIAETGTRVGAEPWMLSTPDRLVIEGHGGHPVSPEVVRAAREENDVQVQTVKWGLECKCRGFFASDQWGDEGSDEVPHSVAAQCHWGMLVTGFERWDVVVLLGGNDYREYTLRADPEIHASLVAAVRVFWHENVLAGVHPPFTGADSDHRYLLKTYPTHTSEIVAPTADITEAAKLLAVHRAAMKRHEDEASIHEARIKEFIGGRLGVEFPFGKITWKHMEGGEVKAFTRKATRRFLPKFDATIGEAVAHD